MLPKQHRLKSNKEISLIIKQGKTVGGKYIVIKFLPKQNDINKFAFIVSNKISKVAVIRNKIKRRLREIIRTHLILTNSKYDFIIFAKKDVIFIDFNTLKQDLLFTLQKIK